MILGRGAPFVLREDPRVLRVRLVGPAERRLAQAMRLQGIDEVTAQRGMRRIDRAHADYIRRFYGVDIDDPTQYHLILDSTALDAGACVDLIARAAFALGAAAGHHDEVA